LERELAERTLRMSKDLDVAADYVRSLIPAPRTTPERIDWRHVPAEELAGDSLGFHDLDDANVAIYLLDVTGHGVDAALMSVTILSVVRSMTLGSVDYHRPDEVLARLNNVFPMHKHEDRLFSMWYGVFNRTHRRLRWAGGGHPPALLLVADLAGRTQVERLSSRGPLVGMLPDMEFAAGECEVAENAVLYVYSDGVYEVDQDDGTEWGIDGLSEYLSGSRSETDGVMDSLLEHVRSLRCKQELDDDFTIIETRF
jgi:sigma-B regulation protein RsbU (phosphoserine phosphatase)